MNFWASTSRTPVILAALWVVGKDCREVLEPESLSLGGRRVANSGVPDLERGVRSCVGAKTEPGFVPYSCRTRTLARPRHCLDHITRGIVIVREQSIVFKQGIM